MPETGSETNEDALRQVVERQRETIAKLLGRIESLKTHVRETIAAHEANAGEWQKDARIINARRALEGKK